MVTVRDVFGGRMNFKTRPRMFSTLAYFAGATSVAIMLLCVLAYPSGILGNADVVINTTVLAANAAVMPFAGDGTNTYSEYFPGLHSLVAWSFADTGGARTASNAAALPPAVYDVAPHADSTQRPHLSAYGPLGPWHLFSDEPFLQDSGSGVRALQYDLHDISAILDVDSDFFEMGKHDISNRRYLVFGSESGMSTLRASAGASSHGAAQMPGGGFFTIAIMTPRTASGLASMGLVVVPDSPLDLHAAHDSWGASGGSFPMAGTVDVGSQNSDFAYTNSARDVMDLRPHASVIDATGLPDMLGLKYPSNDSAATGRGITVAVVDTGVDFSNPDIQHSLARDSVTNHPVMLDPDGQGIVITNHTFYASIDKSGTVRNHAGEIPDGFDSVIYVNGDGVFLDIERGGKGTDIPVYNSLYPAIGSAPVFNGTLEHDMKIGDTNRDYIRSQSGAYRLGAIFQAGAPGLGPDDPSKMQVVPVLVVDSAISGVYDMVVPDMSSSWLDYTRGPGETPDFDFDFTDEKPIVLGSGNEFLLYDSDGDGVTDYTAGTVGARVLDVHSVTNETRNSYSDDVLNILNGTLLPALDPDGRFFGIMSDYDGHGTASSGVITSSGTMTYDIYNDTGSYAISGVAPDAKILPVRALWLGDAVYGWLWSAGFDNYGTDWTFTGRPRADIISNSWGISTFPNLGAAPGYDMLSVILDMLATPRSLDDDYPGVVMISSAGNSGHGYGTVGIPGAASFAISVGASTNNVFVGYGPFRDQPRFGSAFAGADAVEDDDRMVRPNTNRGHIVDFSSRGPGMLGDVRPDLVGIGAYGFVPGSMMGALQNSDTRDPFVLFGGTSMACPAVAGAAAVLMSSMNEMLVDYDPFVVRNILMSTAQDMHNDPFVQGAGLANAGAALDFVRGSNGVFAVYNDASYQNVRKILQPAIDSANITDTGIGFVGLPDRNIPMTTWFAGHLNPGQRSAAVFTVENPGDDSLRVEIRPHVMSLVRATEYSGTTMPHQKDPILNDVDGYVPNYIRLADVHADETLGGLFDDYAKATGGSSGAEDNTDDTVNGDNGTASSALPNRTSLFPEDASLLILTVNFDFSDFMNMTTDVYADDLGIASLYLYDWTDKNADSEITSGELALVTRGGSWGTVQEIRVSDPAGKFAGVPVVGIYPVPLRYSYWTGANGANATSLDYTVSASYYAKERWDSVWPTYDTLTVPPHDSRTVDVTLVAFDDATSGAHQGFVAFVGDNHTVNVPVSFVSLLQVHDADSEVQFGIGNAAVAGGMTYSGYGAFDAAAGAPVAEDDNGSSTMLPDVMYDNEHTRGAFDMVGRYMAGNWHNYYFDVADESTSTASVRISWQSPHTSISAFAVNPAGRIIQTNVPSGTFGHFLDWPSVDWLGGTPFSEGGGFYPAAQDSGPNSGWDTSTFMTVPINGTGTYVIMTHTTLFGGESATEPIAVSIKFHKDTPAYMGTVTQDGTSTTKDGAIHNNTGGYNVGDSSGDMQAANDDGAAPSGNMSSDVTVGYIQGSDGAVAGNANDTGMSDVGNGDNASASGGVDVAPNTMLGSDASHSDAPTLLDFGFGLGLLLGVVAGGATCAVLVFVMLKSKNRAANRSDPDKSETDGVHASPV